MSYVTFTPPKVFGILDNPQDNAAVNLLCQHRAESFPQPGVSLATSEVRRYGIGPIERKPYVPLFLDVGLSFIGDSQGVIHKYFYLWMNSIINFTNLPTGNSPSDAFGKQPFEVEYKENYTTTVEIVTFDEAQNKVGIVRLYNAHPVQIGEVQRSWGDENTLVRIPIQFTYSHWAYDELDLTLRFRKTEPTTKGLFTDIMRATSVLQGITATKRPSHIGDILNVVNTGSTLLRSLSRRIDF